MLDLGFYTSMRSYNAKSARFAVIKRIHVELVRVSPALEAASCLPYPCTVSAYSLLVVNDVEFRTLQKRVA